VAKQLDFGLIAPSFRDTPDEFAQEAELVFDCARQVVEYHGLDWAVDALGRPKPAISQALHRDPKQRRGAHLYLEHVVALVKRAPSEDLLNVIVGARGPDFDEKDQLIALMEAAQEMFGAEVNKYLHATAHRKLLGRAAKRKVGR
jgi:hypothetical protein